MEGDPVTLQHDAEIHTDDLLLWRFGDKGILLAKVDVETKETSLNDADERFKDRLLLDQTGSLTILNSRTEHTGLYEVEIRGRESSQRFLLSVSAVSDLTLSFGEIAAIVAAVLLVAAILAAVVIYYHRKLAKLQIEKEDPVEEGNSFTLHTSTQIHKDDVIKWWYEDDNLIAELDTVKNEKHVYDVADGRFRSKLSLDDTGNLTISDIKTIHSGLYKLKISSHKRTKNKNIFVPVTVKSKSVEKGESVPLETDAKTEGNLILWTFGAEKHLIVKFDSGTCFISEKFRDRLKTDDKTGYVTIKNMDNTDCGQYKLQIINSEQTIIKRFNVSLTESTKKSVNESTPLMREERV